MSGEMAGIDWKKLSAVNLSEIQNSHNHPAIQDNLANILNCNLATEFNMSHVDPNLHKVFNLAQLTIRSLMESQSYLSGVIVAMGDKLKAGQERELKKDEDKEVANERSSRYKKKCTVLNKLMQVQQQMISRENNGESHCQFCAKSFVSLDFLVTHMKKRHSECLQKFNPTLLLSHKNYGIIASESAQKDMGELRTRINSFEDGKVQSSPNVHEMLSELKSGILQKVDEKFSNGNFNQEIESRLEKLKSSFDHEMKGVLQNQGKLTNQIESLASKQKQNNIGELEAEPNENALQQLAETYEEKIRLKELHLRNLAEQEAAKSLTLLNERERQYEGRIEELVSIIAELRLQIKRMERQMRGQHKKVKTNVRDVPNLIKVEREEVRTVESRPVLRGIEEHRMMAARDLRKELEKLGVESGAKLLCEAKYIIIMDQLQIRAKNKLSNNHFFECRQEIMVEMDRRMTVSSSSSVINSNDSRLPLCFNLSQNLHAR